MKKISLAITLFLFLVSSISIKLKAQCLEVYPVDIDGSIYLVGVAPLGLLYGQENYFTISFDGNEENDIVPEINIYQTEYLDFIILEVDVSCNPSFTITNNFGQECTYVNGQLCNDCPPVDQWENLVDCNVIDPNCGQEFIEFILENQESIQSPFSNLSWWTEKLNQNTLAPSVIHPTYMQNGIVSIGTTSSVVSHLEDYNFDLVVKGGIISDNLTIDEDDWADFVFEPEYSLKSLYNLEKYVKENQKLPHFPSEKEIQEQGYDVYRLTKLQQLSLEELFLYLIQLEEELKLLEAE